MCGCSQQENQPLPSLLPMMPNARKVLQLLYAGLLMKLWTYLYQTRSRMIELVSKGLATLERNYRKHMCISMKLVAAVLGDHGQRPHEDYAVVATAVTVLGNGKSKFYSTRDNLFLHKMAITNKSRVVVLNKVNT
ncbi:uncharacterized protein LOC123902828 [Trifolium pratense]|uniref:uncharacterized protein LOC123902828 n=1 Tax=Trifolium pratense TaxID=57577 RepID=UPI001E6967EB|nr:uncharacterized protein LOC123902828 [Trifolium pratense]XP_045808586.1 uncharacterized protein LOC123902828 [Trifolium pratense]